MLAVSPLILNMYYTTESKLCEGYLVDHGIPGILAKELNFDLGKFLKILIFAKKKGEMLIEA